MSMSVFKKLPYSLYKAMAMGYQFAPLHLIIYVKVDLRRKARLFIGLCVVDSSRNKVYMITMKSVSASILFSVAAENGLEVMMGDIDNDYLNL